MPAHRARSAPQPPPDGAVWCYRLAIASARATSPRRASTRGKGRPSCAGLWPLPLLAGCGSAWAQGMHDWGMWFGTLFLLAVLAMLIALAVAVVRRLRRG